MSTEYDPELIQKLADKLYSQAKTAIAIATFLGLVVGGVGGFSSSNGSGVAAIIGLVIGGVIGFLLGQSRAFSLRVQAQIALCQRQIEYNTRH